MMKQSQSADQNDIAVLVTGLKLQSSPSQLMQTPKVAVLYVGDQLTKPHHATIVRRMPRNSPRTTMGELVIARKEKVTRPLWK